MNLFDPAVRRNLVGLLGAALLATTFVGAAAGPVPAPLPFRRAPPKLGRSVGPAPVSTTGVPA